MKRGKSTKKINELYKKGKYDTLIGYHIRSRMNTTLKKCPFCNTELVKDELECVGLEDLDFINKSKGKTHGFRLEIGSISLGSDEVIHGALKGSYQCKKCKKIIAIYDY